VASEWQEAYIIVCLQKKGGWKEKKKIQFKVGCLMHYKGKPSAYYTDMFDEKLAPSVPL